MRWEQRDRRNIAGIIHLKWLLSRMQNDNSLYKKYAEVIKQYKDNLQDTFIPRPSAAPPGVWTRSLGSGENGGSLPFSLDPSPSVLSL
jgi:hypothetical protein